jgi:hypothetical protein
LNNKKYKQIKNPSNYFLGNTKWEQVQNSLNHFLYIKALIAVGLQTHWPLGTNNIVPDDSVGTAYLISSHLMQEHTGHTYTDSVKILRTEQSY